MKRLTFNRKLLPPTAEFYAREGVALRGGGAWRLAPCVFHEDRRPSMSVSVETGGFKCHACGAKGGNVLDFFMQRHGVPFIEAANALGAMEVAK